MSVNAILRRGTIALCSKGSLGLITVDAPQVIEHSNGNKTLSWIGIHLTDKISAIGLPWSSRNPQFIIHVDDLPRAGTLMQLVSHELERIGREGALQEAKKKRNRT